MLSFKEKLQYLLHTVNEQSRDRPSWTSEINRTLVAQRQPGQHICHCNSWSNICRDILTFLESQKDADLITLRSGQSSFYNIIKTALGVGTAAKMQNIDCAYTAFTEAASRYFGHVHETEPDDPSQRYADILEGTFKNLLREINSCPANLRLGSGSDNSSIRNHHDATPDHKGSDTLNARFGRLNADLHAKHAESAGLPIIQHSDVASVEKYYRSSNEWREFKSSETKQKYLSGGHFVQSSRSDCEFRVRLVSGSVVSAYYLSASP